MFRNLWIILALTVSLLAGCSASGEETPAPPITGREWKLVSINGQAILAGSEITLLLDKERASGSAGCNSYGGEYQQKGTQLSFDQIMQTLMACADAAVMEQESTYTQTLSQVTSYQIVGDRLELMDTTEEIVLVFE